MGYKIIRIEQSESEYSSEGGTFCFILNGIPDEKWRQKFSDGMNSYQARHFIHAPLSMAGTNMIKAYAPLDGEHGLSFVSDLLASILVDVNREYDDEKHAEDEAERKQKNERAALDAKVSTIISKIKFG